MQIDVDCFFFPIEPGGAAVVHSTESESIKAFLRYAHLPEKGIYSNHRAPRCVVTLL